MANFIFDYGIRGLSNFYVGSLCIEPIPNLCKFSFYPKYVMKSLFIANLLNECL